MSTLLHDLRYAVRLLRRTPVIAVVAILSLALGIGANAAVFSISEEVLLGGLPVPEPDRLVNLSAPGPKPGFHTCNQAGSCDAPVFSYPMFRDLEAAQEPFTGVAAHRTFVANLATGDQARAGSGVLVSDSYFSVLGLQPALGRLLGPDDDQAVGGQPVAVLSHRFWEIHLGADPTILGERIAINGHPMTVVGVGPPGFEGTTLGVRPDVFVPLTMAVALGDVRGIESDEEFHGRLNYWVYLFGRLKPEVSVAQAHEALNRLYGPIVRDVEAPLQEGMSPQTLARFRAREITVEDGRRGQSTFHSEAHTPLVVLLAVTAIVLLIACANIANLLLARGATRAQELAVRTSLGASRRRLIAQLLTESCLLAMLGGVLSLLVTRWTLSFVGSFSAMEAVSIAGLQARPSILLFTAAVSVGTGFLFGLYPALHATRSDLSKTARANAAHITGARAAMRFRTSLVAAQLAMSMALLVLAGLFLRSLANVSRVDLGLDVDQVATFRVAPKMNGYEPRRAQSLFESLEEELGAIPGVTGIAASRLPLLTGRGWRMSVSVEGFDAGPDTDDGARYNEIGPGYFHTLGIGLLAGREFSSADVGPTPTVAIVNEAFARKFNLGRDVVGKRMALGDDELDIEIVGLVHNAKYHQVKDEAPPQFFFPYRQADVLDVGAMSFYLRTTLPTEDILGSIPGVVSRFDAQLPVLDLESMRHQIREQTSQDRMLTILAASFAVLATLLAAVGLYGVIAYSVAQRTKEIALRMALGAETTRIQAMVLRQVTWLILTGGAIGTAAALALGRASQSLLFGIQARDPWVVVTGAAVVAIVALAAAYIPSRRAAGVDPMIALRGQQ